jgi:hypothetical protein
VRDGFTATGAGRLQSHREEGKFRLSMRETQEKMDRKMLVFFFVLTLSSSSRC